MYLLYCIVCMYMKKKQKIFFKFLIIKKKKLICKKHRQLISWGVA